MHHSLILKVWADTVEEAQSDADTAITDSIDPSENNCGWDYGSAELITDEMLAKDFKGATIDEVVKDWGDIKKEIREQQARLREELDRTLAPLFLSKDEAPLYIDSDSRHMEDQIEKILKRKKDVQLPKTYEQMKTGIVKALTALASEPVGMGLYYLKHIEKLYECIRDPAPYHTLQCTECHYAELPCDDKKGLKPFYFFCDRHF